EAEQDRRPIEDVVEDLGDGDRAAAADEERLRAEGHLECARRGLRHGMTGTDDRRLAGPEIPDLDLDPRRRDLQHVVPEAVEDRLRILIRHEPAADLGMRGGRDDRLAALALEATPDAVDIER